MMLARALLPTVPSLCFLVQSTTIAKVKGLICCVIGEFSEVDGRVGHGLVLAWFYLCVLRLVFLDSSLQPPGQEKHFGIHLHIIVHEIHLY